MQDQNIMFKSILVNINDYDSYSMSHIWLIPTFYLECIPNIRTEGGDKEQFRNETHIAKIDPSDGSCVLMHYQNELQAAEFTLLGNLFLSEGKQGKGKWFKYIQHSWTP